MTDIAELRRLEAEAKYASTTTEFVVAAHKLFDALPELLKALEWRSIDSAPRDGTKCLFFSPGKTGAHNESAREAHYRIDSFSDRWPSARHQYPEALYTHWRPLPLPPHGGVDVG